MRAVSTLLGFASALTLAACGGDTRPQTVGSTPPAGGGVAVTPAPTPSPGATPTPTASDPRAGGSGAGVFVAGTTVTDPTYVPNTAHFLNVAAATTFQAQGSFHTLTEETSGASVYQGNASTVNTPSGTVDYNPRDGIFTLKINDTAAGYSGQTYRFQDPAHRIDFNPNSRPELEVPNLDGFNYLVVLTDISASPAATATFFYQRPGNSTTYVSLAGFVQTNSQATQFTAQRGVFVFGTKTAQLEVPRSGTGTYTGGFIATMVNNPTFDSAAPNSSFLQWLSGNSSIAVNFGTGQVALDFAGRVGETYYHDALVPSAALSTTLNTPFFATGRATIDLIRTGGFSGRFDSACFAARCGEAGAIPIDFASISPGSSTAGASSIDGAFYGPNAVNLGGNFRIIGGVPDQRVDIQGAFTGAKRP